MELEEDGQVEVDDVVDDEVPNGSVDQVNKAS